MWLNGQVRLVPQLNLGTLVSSRVVIQSLLLVMRKLARFCGIKSLIPPGGDVKDGEERLLSHLRTLYSRVKVGASKSEWDQMRTEGNASAVEERIAALKDRMCDVSKWVEEVKVRLRRLNNRLHGRMGTLSMGPFKSVLVEAGSRWQSVRTLQGRPPCVLAWTSPIHQSARSGASGAP